MFPFLRWYLFKKKTKSIKLKSEHFQIKVVKIISWGKKKTENVCVEFIQIYVLSGLFKAGHQIKYA